MTTPLETGPNSADVSADTPIEQIETDDTGAAEYQGDNSANGNQPCTDGEEDQGDNPDDEPYTGTRAGRDAAKYRAQLREAESQRDTITAERDQLRDQLAADRRAMIDWRAQNPGRLGHAKLDRELLDAAGLDVAALVSEETGQLDMQAVDAFIAEAAARFNVAKGFAPDRAQGAVREQRASKGIAAAFRQ